MAPGLGPRLAIVDPPRAAETAGYGVRSEAQGRAGLRSLPLRLVNADTRVQRAGVAATAQTPLPIRPAEVQVGWG